MAPNPSLHSTLSRYPTTSYYIVYCLNPSTISQLLDVGGYIWLYHIHPYTIPQYIPLNPYNYIYYNYIYLHIVGCINRSDKRRISSMTKSAPISPCDFWHLHVLSHRLSGLYSSDSPPAAPSGAIEECLGTWVNGTRSTVLIHENWKSIQNWDPTMDYIWIFFLEK